MNIFLKIKMHLYSLGGAFYLLLVKLKDTIFNFM